MKAKIILLAVLCALCVVLVGCDDGRKAEKRDSYGVKPNMIMYGKWADGYFYYAVDDRSGIVYIIGGAGNWGYMAPAYNADGTLMTQAQLDTMRE